MRRDIVAVGGAPGKLRSPPGKNCPGAVQGEAAAAPETVDNLKCGAGFRRAARLARLLPQRW